MASKSPAAQGSDSEIADFDVHGALELHVQLGVPMPLAEKPVVVEDVTKRCAVMCLTVMQEVIQHVGGSGNMEAFLSDIRALLRQLAKGDKKAKGADGDRAPKIVEDIDLQRFYAGAHTPMAFTKKLAARLKDWSDDADLPLDNDAVRRICWKYYLKEKERVVTNPDWLSSECNYRLFLIYNRLLLKDDTTDLEVGQVNAFLMKMVQMLGFLWSVQHEYKAEGSSCVNFPEFITLVTEYFQRLHLNTELTCELIGDLMDLLVNGVLRKGYLTKKGHVRKNWKRRFFVLKTDSLHYYRDRDQTDKKGVLAMNLNTKLIDVKDSEDPKHPNKFVVTCGKKGVPFEIVADSKQEKHYWMQAVTKAIALYQLNCSLSKKEFEDSMAGWRRSTYGVGAPEYPTEALAVPVSQEGTRTSIMKREIKQKVEKVMKDNRTSMTTVDISHSLEDRSREERSATSRQKASSQRVTGPYVPMQRSLSDSSSPVGLCDYEAMALTNTSSDSEIEEEDDNGMYINFSTPRKSSGGMATRSKGSTSSADRQMVTVKEEVGEERAESQRYVNFDPLDESMPVVKEDAGEENKENHRYVNFGLEGDEEEVARVSVSCANGGVPTAEDEDSCYVKPEEKGLKTTTSPRVQKPYENWSKSTNSQPDDADAVTAKMSLDLSDRGSRRKTSQRTTHEVVKTKALKETLALERSASVSSSSDEEEGTYIKPTEIASIPTPAPRKSTTLSKREASVSSENDLYLQM